MTALPPGTETTMTLERRGPLRRFGRALLRFLGTTVRMWIVLIALGVGLVLIWAVSSNVKSIDRRLRSRSAGVRQRGPRP